MVGIARTVMPTGPRFANANNWFACRFVISALLQLKSLTRKSLAARRPRDKHPGPGRLLWALRTNFVHYPVGFLNWRKCGFSIRFAYYLRLTTAVTVQTGRGKLAAASQ